MFWQNSIRCLGGKAAGLKLGLLAGATVAMLAAAAPAHAGVRIAFGFSIPFVAPIPTFVQPQPIYYAPPAVNYPPVYAPAPAPAICPPPQPIYYSPPAYCPPPAVYQAPQPVFYHPMYRPRVVWQNRWGAWRRPDRDDHAWYHGDRGGRRDFAQRRDWH